MQLGKINSLEIKRFAPPGAYLVDQQENEVLLPKKYLTEDLKEGSIVEVFIMKDSAERLVAIKQIPYLLLGECAYMTVVEINPYGAFVDWGLDKDLFVPFAEQRQKLEVGEKHLFALLYDYDTDRLYGTMKLRKILSPCTDQSLSGKEVQILVGDLAKLGRNVIVNMLYEGLIYNDHLIQTLTTGQQLTGYVSKVRTDGKLDIRLEIPNDARYDAAEKKILNILAENNGFIALTDKSQPEQVREMLGISKKTFKQALGKLYKYRRIAIDTNGIRSLNNNRKPND